ncbi:MAG TPA: hypothetical protein VF323_04555 [Candidatus Limnocylindrales bacterium]
MSEAVSGLEATWAEAMRVFGDLVVARSRGEPLDPASGSTRALARRFHALRRALDPHLERALAAATGPDERRAVETIRDSVAWFDEVEPLPARSAGSGFSTPPGLDGDPVVANLRRAVFRRYGRAAAAVRVGGATFDRLTVLERLAKLDDPADRRRHFEALAPVWRSIDGDGGRDSPYRRLVRSTADRWARRGSPIEASAGAVGLAPGTLEPMLWSILDAWRAVTGGGWVEPWDRAHADGAAARRLDGFIPLERLQPLNDAHLAALGADRARLGIGYDIVPRPGRPVIPVAFTIDRGVEADDRDGWRARAPWVFATYGSGGLGNLVELLHESGHAVQAAAVRARPAFAGYPMASAGFLEAVADVLGWDADEPAWQRHHLGVAATAREAARHRYGAVVLDMCWALFEMAVHRDPDRRPNDVWTEITSRGLGLVPHPEWSWWAMRGQLIDGPGYLANYALSAIVAAAIRERLRELRGDWSTGDPRWYGFMSEALFASGSERAPADLLRDFLGGPVTAEPLLADLRRAAG